MAAKKRKKKKSGANLNKSAFVRSLPGDLPAKDVVAAAAKKGMKLDEKYVYNIRSADRQRGGAPRGRGRPAAAPRGRGGDLEAQLRTIVAELGLARARAVFADVEAAFSG